MILEVPFLPADPKLRQDDWFTSPDYQRLRLYSCDRIRITGFEFRMRKPKTKDGAAIPVQMRIRLFSPTRITTSW
jgi:hypothetical protein